MNDDLLLNELKLLSKDPDDNSELLFDRIVSSIQCGQTAPGLDLSVSNQIELRTRLQKVESKREYLTAHLALLAAI